MQVRDNDTQLLYGLFQSICSWALEKGYKDISGMKNLLKLAMVDVCRERHTDKSSFAAQMAIVTDLGISLRNVQYALKTLDELKDLSGGFAKIHQIQEEIVILLTRRPQTLDDILAEVSYLIHAPHDLQRRTLRSILKDLEHKGMISTILEDGITYYRPEQPHVNVFDPKDLSSRVSGLLTHIDAFNHTVGRPILRTYYLSPVQAGGLQTAINEFLLGTGNAYELECKETDSITKPYSYYLGCTPIIGRNSRLSVSDAILEVIHTRFTDSELPALARTHWYHLTPAISKAVFREVRNFIEREGISAGQESACKDAIPFAVYFGLADRKNMESNEEIQS